jgi:hypothetical protein
MRRIWVTLVVALFLTTGCSSRSSQGVSPTALGAGTSGAPGSTEASATPPGLSSVTVGEIVFQAPDGSIHAIRSDGTGERRVADPPPRLAPSQGPAKILAWLPGQQIVACVADNTTTTALAEVEYPLYFVDLRTQKVTRLRGEATSLLGDYGELYDNAILSHDGTKLLYYTNNDENEHAADVRTGVVKVLSWPSAARMIWPHGPKGLKGNVIAASDSERFLLVRREYGYEVGPGRIVCGVFDRETGETKSIFVYRNTPDPYLVQASFSPDAKLVVLETASGSGEERFGQMMSNSISVVDALGVRTARVATGAAPVFWPGP